MSEPRSTPPYPEHECEGCNRGLELLISTLRDLRSGAYSSIVGQGAIHLPEGWVCTKYLNPDAYAAYKKLQESRKP
jgi:hypothetical protein